MLAGDVLVLLGRRGALPESISILLFILQEVCRNSELAVNVSLDMCLEPSAQSEVFFIQRLHPSP